MENKELTKFLNEPAYELFEEFKSQIFFDFFKKQIFELEHPNQNITKKDYINALKILENFIKKFSENPEVQKINYPIFEIDEGLTSNIFYEDLKTDKLDTNQAITYYILLNYNRFNQFKKKFNTAPSQEILNQFDQYKQDIFKQIEFPNSLKEEERLVSKYFKKENLNEYKPMLRAGALNEKVERFLQIYPSKKIIFADPRIGRKEIQKIITEIKSFDKRNSDINAQDKQFNFWYKNKQRNLSIINKILDTDSLNDFPEFQILEQGKQSVQEPKSEKFLTKFFNQGGLYSVDFQPAKTLSITNTITHFIPREKSKISLLNRYRESPEFFIKILKKT